MKKININPVEPAFKTLYNFHIKSKDKKQQVLLPNTNNSSFKFKT